MAVAAGNLQETRRNREPMKDASEALAIMRFPGKMQSPRCAGSAGCDSGRSGAPCQHPRARLHPGVIHGRPDRPYLESWLRRARKQLAASGRLSELALILSRQEGGGPEHWSTLVRSILEEQTTPSLDLLTRIDAVLAKPVERTPATEQPGLF